ncbi:hypothetical protein [Candidatus Tisiphia endosymbiont of Myopa tessellatipennis]|uniref:hypothetical protein n=1 Tax=Candidatus Tisiphia endosymbiont of Myopa tessellatipennis TaxID=3066257 RepID=UPI003977C6BC
MATTYIGVDVSKKTLSIYMPATNKAFEVTNDQHGFTTILSTINKYYPVLSELIVVFEPTGGYEHNLREFLKIDLFRNSLMLRDLKETRNAEPQRTLMYVRIRVPHRRTNHQQK